MKTVFIDGRAGTTGLRIRERLLSRGDVKLVELDEADRKNPDKRREALCDCDVSFLCLPDDAAREAAQMAANSNALILDASTAHRTDPAWAYGFPELSKARYEQVRNAKRIAVPGCHASGFVALIAPLTAAGVLSKDAYLSATSLTGYSGGGKKMIAQYEGEGREQSLDSPRIYGLSQAHKHLPEMAAATGLTNAPTFLPIVADYYSGMLVTVPVHASLLKGGAEAARDMYRALYTGSVVKYVDAIDEAGFAASNARAGRDDMLVTVAGNGERVLLMALFDNLGKGASGAAIECMNVATGAEADSGLIV